jgi:hypothetical protein
MPTIITFEDFIRQTPFDVDLLAVEAATNGVGWQIVSQSHDTALTAPESQIHRNEARRRLEAELERRKPASLIAYGEAIVDGATCYIVGNGVSDQLGPWLRLVRTTGDLTPSAAFFRPFKDARITARYEPEGRPLGKDAPARLADGREIYYDRVDADLALGTLRATLGRPLVIDGGQNAIALAFFRRDAVGRGATFGTHEHGQPYLRFPAERLDDYQTIIVAAERFRQATTIPPDPNTVLVRAELSRLGARWNPKQRTWYLHDPNTFHSRDAALRATESALLDVLYPVSTLAHVRGEEIISGLARRKDFIRTGLMLAKAYNVPGEILPDPRDMNLDKWLDHFGVADGADALRQATTFLRAWNVELTAEIIAAQRGTNAQDLSAEKRAREREADQLRTSGHVIPDTRERHDLKVNIPTTNGARQPITLTRAGIGPGIYAEDEAARRNELRTAKDPEQQKLVYERESLRRRACEVQEVNGASTVQVPLDREEGHYVGNLIAFSTHYIAMNLHRDGRGGYVIIPVEDISWDAFRDEINIRAGWTNYPDHDTGKPKILTVAYTLGTADIVVGEQTKEKIRKRFGRDPEAERQFQIELQRIQASQATRNQPSNILRLDRKTGHYVGEILYADAQRIVQATPQGLAVHACHDAATQSAAQRIGSWHGKTVSIAYTLASITKDGSERRRVVFDAAIGEKSADEIRARYGRKEAQTPPARKATSPQRARAREEEGQVTGISDSEFERDRAACSAEAIRAIVRQNERLRPDLVVQLPIVDGAFSGPCVARSRFHAAQQAIGGAFRMYEVVALEHPPNVGDYFQVVVENELLQRVDIKSREELARMNAVRALEGKAPIDEHELIKQERTDEKLRRAFMQRLQHSWRNVFGKPPDLERTIAANDNIRGIIVDYDENFVATNVFANGKYDNTRCVLHPRERRELVANAADPNGEPKTIVHCGLERSFGPSDIGSEITVNYRSEPDGRLRCTIIKFVPRAHRSIEAKTDIQQQLTKSAADSLAIHDSSSV